MAKHFRGQTGLRVFSTPRPRLIDFLEKLSAGLGTHQTVGEEFTKESLMEMSAEFNLTDSDWGGLCCMIHRIRERPAKGLQVAQRPSGPLCQRRIALIYRLSA